VQDTALTQRNVSLSDSKILPSKNNAEKPVSVNFSYGKEAVKIVGIPQYDRSADTVISSNKKSLPPDIRDHFEANSSAFLEFAQKKDANVTKKIEDSSNEDVWDRALLFGEYPEGKIPVVIDTNTGKAAITVPKKPIAENLGGVLPNQFLSDIKKDAGILPERKENRPASPISIRVEKITLPRFVPKKPENTVQTTNNEKNGPVKNITIPTKPQQTQEKESLTDSMSMGRGIGESLQKKIIEGQMRSVFENAPIRIKESLEKMTVQDILSLKETTEGDQDSDYFWKRRLRDYIQKIKAQGKTTLKNPLDIEPKEGETVIAFIERVYPMIMKNEATES